MNGIEKITARIEADAQAEAAAIKAEAQGRCDAIRAESEKQAQEVYDTRLKAGAAECAQRAQRSDSSAAMEARKATLALKQDMVSEAFALAGKKVCALPEAQYVAFLAGQAAKAARTGHEEIILNARDLAAVGEKTAAAANELLKAKGVDARLTLGAAPRPIEGGVILKDGNIEVNCTVESLTELYRSELASRVAGVLFDA